MKYLIILADGMADEPIEALGYRTPLQYISTPSMDRLATIGRCGLFKSVPDGFHPGSEVANLSVLGYNLHDVYEGRGVLEAASIGVDISPDEIAMRCNLVCIEGDLLKNHSAGHISTEEATVLIEFLQEKLGGGDVNFFPGVSYRNLLKLRGGNKQLDCTPPHDIPLTPFRPSMIKALEIEAEATAQQLNDLIMKSQELLKEHPINIARMQAGKDPANSIWPWSPGKRPNMRTLSDLYGFKEGSVISAVDLIHGIGVYAGLKSVFVEGATGLYDTNYEGKVEAALNELKTKDFVFLHIEACDEAGHEGGLDLKIRCIQDIDRRVVKRVLDEMLTWDEPVTISLLPDHPTPIATRTHTMEPVPFVIYRTGMKPDNVFTFDESVAGDGEYGLIEGDQFMTLFTGK